MKNIRIKFLILYNILLFKNKKIAVGKNFRIRGKIGLQIKKNGVLKIGDNFMMSSGLNINPLGRNISSCIRIDDNATISIGNNVGISCSVLWAKNGITIGNNTKVGADVIIMDSDMHSLDYKQRRDLLTDASNAKSAPIHIGDDAFIGTRSIITKGVSIGNCSIIASGSIVTKSIPDGEIWGGNPAKFIKNIK